MAERLVDVLNSEKIVLHTYPIQLEAKGAISLDTDFERKAAEAAAFSHLVPDAELDGLSMKMHVSHSGHLEPFGDHKDVLSETREYLDSSVRRRAYFLWENNGRQEGKSEDYWLSAQMDQMRERAYGLWERGGRREGFANEDWQETRAFETS